MIKQPLFGQDSSPHVTSMFISAIATLVCWIIFCIMCLVIKFKPAVPEYKEIQIVLDSTPVVEKNAVPEPVEGQQAEAAVPEPVEGQTPVAEAKVEAPKKEAAPAKPKTTTQPKTQTTTKTTDPSKKVDFDNIQYATDYSDFDFNNVSSNNKTNTQKNWDDYFTDDNTTTNNQTAAPQKVNTSSSMQGSSGTKTTETTQSQKSSSNNTAASSSSSGTTNNQLDAIRNTTGSTSTGSSSNSTLNQKFSSALDMTWNGGAARKATSTLKIDLDNYSQYIERPKTTVKIEFSVDEKGYVISGSVTITPESLLKVEVRQAVISQISQWRFSEDSTRSTATFEYTIEKTIQ
ncbi:MAG: hypothetical protein J6T20_04045 [Treponema sp.]|nr:hypothetical protein [Treponema sp.]